MTGCLYWLLGGVTFSTHPIEKASIPAVSAMVAFPTNLALRQSLCEGRDAQGDERSTRTFALRTTKNCMTGFKSTMAAVSHGDFSALHARASGVIVTERHRSVLNVRIQLVR